MAGIYGALAENFEPGLMFLPPVRCTYGCNFPVGGCWNFVLSKLEQQEKLSDIFDQLKLKYCCRQSLMTPQQISSTASYYDINAIEAINNPDSKTRPYRNMRLLLTPPEPPKKTPVRSQNEHLFIIDPLTGNKLNPASSSASSSASSAQDAEASKLTASMANMSIEDGLKHSQDTVNTLRVDPISGYILKPGDVIVNYVEVGESPIDQRKYLVPVLQRTLLAR